MDRKALVENEWITVYEDKYKLSDGHDCTYYHIKRVDAVMMLAVDANRKPISTYVVSQHRHPIDRKIWQFPIGGFDPAKQSATAAARRELREETGIVAGETSYIGSFFTDPGLTDQKLHVCATIDITAMKEQCLEDTEQDLVYRRVAVDEIEGLIDSGDMGDAWGLAGQFYLCRYIRDLR